MTQDLVTMGRRLPSPERLSTMQAHQAPGGVM